MSDKSKTINSLNTSNELLNSIFERLSILDASLLNGKPSDLEWSAVQVLNHLYEAEFLTLQHQLYKEKEGFGDFKETFKTKIRYHILVVAYILPIKFKAPKLLESPSNSDNFTQLQEKYAALRKDFQLFLERQNEAYFKIASAKHPAVGRIPILKMVRFFRLHILHHEKQILRTLIKLSK